MVKESKKVQEMRRKVKAEINKMEKKLGIVFSFCIWNFKEKEGGG